MALRCRLCRDSSEAYGAWASTTTASGTALRLAKYLIDPTAERPVRDIARSHEFVIYPAPAAAVPAAGAPARDCILKVGVAVVLAHDFPRERRADPRKQFHR